MMIKQHRNLLDRYGGGYEVTLLISLFACFLNNCTGQESLHYHIAFSHWKPQHSW